MQIAPRERGPLKMVALSGTQRICGNYEGIIGGGAYLGVCNDDMSKLLQTEALLAPLENPVGFILCSS